MQVTTRSTVDGESVVLTDPAFRGELELSFPVILEVWASGNDAAPSVRVDACYDSVSRSGEQFVGEAAVETPLGRFVVRDEWRGGATVSVKRSLAGASGDDQVGVRLLLEARVGAARFREAEVFAPPALYALDDIDGDGLDDYLDTDSITFRDDRLSALAVLAFIPDANIGLALSRADVPQFDSAPERQEGETQFLQTTDIGAMGVIPTADGGVTLSAAFPFVERARSHALTSEGREPWGAYWPVEHEMTSLFEVSYDFRAIPGDSAIESLWRLWEQRARELAPVAVELTETLEEITRLRLESLVSYYGESRHEGQLAAGFVTNCHPQDGKQLENIIQYGFTGQNVLNAHHVLSYADQLTDSDARRKALNVIDFFVRQASASSHGLIHTLYDLDSGRSANWWSGLVLPLAYADDGADLRALMGPVYEHMKYAIEPLREIDGTYLRCMAEEYAALLRAFEAERERGLVHDEWLDVARRFAAFLLAEQEEDGSWRRAYDFHGDPLIEPSVWFGRADLNQKSSTATAVPFLVELHRLTGEGRWLEAAVRAERYAAERFVFGMKFNGGIHDSIYARAQLVDSESILYCMRASLAVWKVTHNEEVRVAATAAARILSTWIFLWDVPLPPTSTLAAFEFRSTGWSGCDTAGAGYVHPYEITAAPDLLELALADDDPTMAKVAELVLAGSSETVAVPGKSWGLAAPGLQEEGLLISWWLIDDPMFVGTGFGGRGKGEGNKTCLPWISAVSIDAFGELMRRFGTTDIAEYWGRDRLQAQR